MYKLKLMIGVEY